MAVYLPLSGNRIQEIRLPEPGIAADNDQLAWP